MYIKDISEKFNINEITAKVLYNRGYKSYFEIEKFLKPNLTNLHNPYRMKNINSIASQIQTSIEFGDNIAIWGDYDVDGITSSALLCKTLEKLGNENTEVYISNRYSDGYGLSYNGIDKLKEKKIDLIITVDCGISQKEYIDYANSQGIEVIVTDHHECDEEDKLADCLFLDPKVNQEYPFQQLSGCGVTWKLCQVLLDDDLYEYLDLVALSTIADVVDLVDENRIIAKYGLRQMNRKGGNLGINQLIKVNELENKTITTGDVGYTIAPCINAVGRLMKADVAFKLLVSDDENETFEIAEELKNHNKERQNITKEAFKRIEEKIDLSKNILVAKEKIMAGILGIIAGDLKEKYRKPAIVISEDGKGSCRSVSPLNMYKMLQKHQDLMEGYGGHKMACGLSLKKGKFKEFKKCVEEYTKEIKYDAINYDFEIEDTNKLSIDLVKELDKLRPFGKGNPKPKFKSIVDLQSLKCVGQNNEHLKFIIDDDIDAIGFNLISKITECKNKKMKMIYAPEINNFQGRKLQLNVYDIQNAVSNKNKKGD